VGHSQRAVGDPAGGLGAAAVGMLSYDTSQRRPAP
jgi:hypothetical protein